MTAQEAADRIHQAAWTGRTPGLSRTVELLARLGDPHKGLKYVHVAGSNGKGSTAAMTASILRAAGLRTGLFTSPHLWAFTERFRVDGQPISEEALGRITQQVLDTARNMDDPATEFELMTAIGMLWFREMACDLVVLEVGLGGRLDSTNVIPAPEAAVITRIALEHTQILGSTLPVIAGEKAGILKPGCHAILYHQSGDVEDVVKEACARLNIPLTVTAPERLERLSYGREGQTFRYRNKGPYHISLLGRHQADNAAVALDVIDALRRRGWDIPEEAVMLGLEQARWPARMERLRTAPDVLLDGGHNPQCMEAIRATLEELYPGQRVLFLTGVLEDKDYPAMVGHLLPIAKGFVTITPDSPRALPADKLARRLKEAGVPAWPCGTIAQGVEQVLELAGPEDVVCICGSLYTAGEVRHILTAT